jgi:methylmalonyl-CoA mutase
MSLDLSSLTDTAFPAYGEADWREAVAKVLKGGSFETLRTPTLDDITIEPIYTAARSALPIWGKRGAAPWIISQRIEHPDVANANRLALADLDGGASGLDLIFTGSPHAHGYGIEDRADIAPLLDGMMADLIAIQIDAGPQSTAKAHAIIAWAAANGIKADKLDLHLIHDPIGMAAQAGGCQVPLIEVLSETGRDAAALARDLPAGTLLTADGRVWHEAGASRVETLAAMLASAVAYWRTLEAAGLPIDEAASRIGFTLAIDQNQFSGIAEIRALRLLWSRATSAAGIAAPPVRIHAETSFRMMSRLDANTNLIRTTIAAFAAGVGGADSITVLPFSAANGLPDAFARRLARNMQLILLEEANLFRVADPAAGAGRVEAETEELARAAWSLFQEIEASGGIVANLAAGTLQARIKATAAARSLDISEGRMPIVGASIFPLAGDRLDGGLEAIGAREPVPMPINVAIPALAPHRLSKPFETRK